MNSSPHNQPVLAIYLMFLSVASLPVCTQGHPLRFEIKGRKRKDGFEVTTRVALGLAGRLYKISRRLTSHLHHLLRIRIVARCKGLLSSQDGLLTKLVHNETEE